MSFCLVTTDVSGDQFEIHRLVQFSAKRWLEWKKKSNIRIRQGFTILYERIADLKTISRTLITFATANHFYTTQIWLWKSLVEVANAKDNIVHFNDRRFSSWKFNTL